MSDRIASIGFIGLGAMGLPMARRLLEGGRDVVAYDIDNEKRNALRKLPGARTVDSLAGVATCDCIIAMLPNSDAVDAVLAGEGGLIPMMRSGAIVIDMGSSVPGRTLALQELARTHGIGLIDAPVSGGVARAVAGELAIMVGGEDAHVARVAPILERFGSVLRTGGVGTGHAMKALNNLVSAGGFLVGIEALLIGRRFGLDPDTMVDVLNASTGVNNSTQKKFKQFVISRSFDSGFRLDLMVKDLSIAMRMADTGGVAAPFSALCRELWQAASFSGVGPDHTAMARFCERLAGFEIADSGPVPLT